MSLPVSDMMILLITAISQFKVPPNIFSRIQPRLVQPDGRTTTFHFLTTFILWHLVCKIKGRDHSYEPMANFHTVISVTMEI